MDGSKFMTKRCMRDSIRDLCIPNAITKEVTVTVTHVSLNQFYLEFNSIGSLKIIENIYTYRLKIVQNFGSNRSLNERRFNAIFAN